MAFLPSPVLDALPIDELLELYSDPRQSVESLAAMLGVNCSSVYARLTRYAPRYAQAQELRARRIHELAILTIYEEPQRIIDTAGNERIDPAHISLLKFRHDSAARMAGILDRRLADKAQVEVVHEVGQLEQFIQRIAQQGGQHVPIAAIEGEAVRVDDLGGEAVRIERIERETESGGT
jgi:predicted metal-dependent phosphoesterase TrpH